MNFNKIKKRVNKVANFWADTHDVDYVEGLSKEEILYYDKENKEDYFIFKKELRDCGY